MINSNINSFQSNLGGVKIIRFNLDSDSCRVDIPVGIFLNSKNFYDVLFSSLELDLDVRYRIGFSFVGADDFYRFVDVDSVSFVVVEEYMLFNPSDLLYGKSDGFYSGFYKFVKDCRGKIESKTGFNCSVVDVIIHEDGDVNVIYEDECD
jgi:hypothetical protein